METSHTRTTPENAAKLTPVEARSAVKLGSMRYVLGISVALAVLAMILAYLVA